MANKMGVDAMRAKIEKLTEQVKQLTIKNATLQRSLERAKERSALDKMTDEQKGQLAKAHEDYVLAERSNERRCSCGLRLFNGKCLSCKKKNTPLSTF